MTGRLGCGNLKSRTGKVGTAFKCRAPCTASAGLWCFVQTLDLVSVILRNPLPAGLERWQGDLAEEKEGNTTVI